MAKPDTLNSLISIFSEIAAIRRQRLGQVRGRTQYYLKLCSRIISNFKKKYFCSNQFRPVSISNRHYYYIYYYFI